MEGRAARAAALQATFCEAGSGASNYGPAVASEAKTSRHGVFSKIRRRGTFSILTLASHHILLSILYLPILRVPLALTIREDK